MRPEAAAAHAAAARVATGGAGAARGGAPEPAVVARVEHDEARTHLLLDAHLGVRARGQQGHRGDKVVGVDEAIAAHVEETPHELEELGVHVVQQPLQVPLRHAGHSLPIGSRAAQHG